ncbi:hypothetical protein OOZ63_00675 [Paucibacter sp. PLA-PC-4]|uniref:hypothetical protein n=1 Tax=Paucibacter sp. PLA-PC-4 TaxID=2993655 RepID=UPI002248E3CE|nr:hypothetical protein [Paucibacter sp. PLA-PC-4]MCX2860351.1 hypothetical protein [Paucibacter sp. PLA-PC-4]
MLWRRELRQSKARAVADLSWQPDGTHLRARLERELAGCELRGWRSEGGSDP